MWSIHQTGLPSWHVIFMHGVFFVQVVTRQCCKTQAYIPTVKHVGNEQHTVETCLMNRRPWTHGFSLKGGSTVFSTFSLLTFQFLRFFCIVPSCRCVMKTDTHAHAETISNPTLSVVWVAIFNIRGAVHLLKLKGSQPGIIFIISCISAYEINRVNHFTKHYGLLPGSKLYDHQDSMAL